jgi:serpin B
LWAQQGYKFVGEFLKVTREQYGAELGQVNFQAQTEAARQAINRWVEQQTAGKIQNLIPVGRLSPQSRLVLTNAIYFKGDWETPFKKSRTHNDDFSVSGDKKVSVPMMQMTEDFDFAHVGNVKILRMPYRGNRLSMVIVLPDESAGLAKVEESLSGQQWKEWTDALRNREVWVTLPRFKTTSEFMLNGALSDLGMPLAFDPGAADFSGMNGKQDLFIGLVVHKAFVDVNEQGTEAAAATGVVAVEAAPVRERPEEFHADHPFIFAIMDNRAGSILFLGRVLNPMK